MTGLVKGCLLLVICTNHDWKGIWENQYIFKRVAKNAKPLFLAYEKTVNKLHENRFYISISRSVTNLDICSLVAYAVHCDHRIPHHRTANWADEAIKKVTIGRRIRHTSRLIIHNHVRVHWSGKTKID